MHVADPRLRMYRPRTGVHREPPRAQYTDATTQENSKRRFHEAIDYRLSDTAFDPDDSQQPFYSEKTVRLRSYWCYPAPADAADVSPPPASTHPAGTISFGCLNDVAKASDLTLSIWADLLHALPNSRLLLHAPNAVDKAYVTRAFTAAGIALARIAVVDKAPMADCFNLYHRTGIALDPTPWCGGTTTCDALWMGVPVVSMIGQTAISRGGLSIMSQIGLTDLVARDRQGYIATAIALSRNLPRLTNLRATLHDTMRSSPLMDAPGVTRDFESHLKTMWRHWCQKPV